MVRESWRDIDTELQRRYDLIPNLVTTVKGYAAHERAIFDSVTQLRTEAMAEHGPPDSRRRSSRPSGAALRSSWPSPRATPTSRRARTSSRCSTSWSRRKTGSRSFATHLQRQRARVRLARADLPVVDRREAVQLPNPAVFRGRARRARLRRTHDRSRPDAGLTLRIAREYGASGRRTFSTRMKTLAHGSANQVVRRPATSATPATTKCTPFASSAVGRDHVVAEQRNVREAVVDHGRVGGDRARRCPGTR